MLRDVWWPHPAHGCITIRKLTQLVVFECACGGKLRVPLFVARDLGLI